MFLKVQSDIGKETELKVIANWTDTLESFVP